MSTHHDDVSGDVDGLVCDECNARLMHFTGGAPVVSSTLDDLRAWARADSWIVLQLPEVGLDRNGVDVCGRCTGAVALIDVIADDREKIRTLERKLAEYEGLVADLHGEGVATGAS